MANRGTRGFLDQVDDDFWNPQIEQVQINHHEEANHVHIIMDGDQMHFIPAGMPLFLPNLPVNEAQRNNDNRQYMPFCRSFDSKILVKLLKSNHPEDRKQLNSIVAYIASAQKKVLCASLFRNGYDVNVLNEKNQTMLHVAFYNNSHSIITMIMDSPSFNKSSIDYTDSSGLTHLHIACAYGNAELAERYLKTGSKVNAVYQFDMVGESSQFTPLHFAVSRKKQHVVKLLLQYCADVNLTSLKGQTPLHLACCCGHTDDNSKIMEDLIANSNVNINARDNQGNTPLLSLFCHKYDDPLRYEFKIEEIESRFDILMKAGADVTMSNEEGDTVLHLLIKSLRFGHNPYSFDFISFNDTEFARLIKKVLDTNCQIVASKNKLDKTPLQLAVNFISFQIVQLLLDYNVTWDDLKFEYFYYPNVVPVFEPVQTLLAIVDILSERGHTLSPGDNIHILTFLIHESYNCECPTYDHECCSRNKFETILNFGSPKHVVHTLRKSFENENVVHYHNKVDYPLQFYSDLTNTGNFYVDAEVKRFLEEKVGSVYTEDQIFQVSKRTELKRLESTVIKNDLNLYDMMLKNPHDISRLFNNSDFSRTFADTFSLYRGIVKGHITKALIRSYVETSTYEVLKQKFFSPLPDLCCDIIIRLLSNLDILHMSVAAHSPTISC